MKNKAMLLLFVCVGFLLAGVMGWWCYERRFTSDERLFRARDRDMQAAICWWSLKRVIPWNWADRPFLAGWDYLLGRASEKEALLVERGYFTNYHFAVTNLPLGVTNSQLLFAEIDRRLAAYLPDKSNEWRSLSAVADEMNGKIALTCRKGQMEDFLHAIQTPIPLLTNTPAD